MKNVYIKKQRESRSWDTKVQLLLDMKTEMKKKDGDLDDIETMKKGIHRMNVKYLMYIYINLNIICITYLH